MPKSRLIERGDGDPNIRRHTGFADRENFLQEHAMEYREKTAELADGTITYHVIGNGPPVLHFHGGGGFRPCAMHERLAERFQVHAMVAPGFDGTEKIDKIASLDALARLYGSFVDTVIGRPCNIVGHSFGGRVAIWFAVQMPEKVDRMVLECPSGFSVGGQDLPDDADGFKRALYVFPEKAGPELKSAEMLANNRKTLPHYIGGTERQFFEDKDTAIAERLGDVGVPTLILYGLQDGVISLRSVEFLRDRIPGARLTTIPEAAHALEIDQPERVAEAIAAFFSGDSGSSADVS